MPFEYSFVSLSMNNAALPYHGAVYHSYLLLGTIVSENLDFYSHALGKLKTECSLYCLLPHTVSPDFDPEITYLSRLPFLVAGLSEFSRFLLSLGNPNFLLAASIFE